jgi:hypothetical protein
VFDFSLCQINEFFNCGCRFVVYTCCSSVCIGDNISDPKIYLHLDLPAADYVVVYVGRHMCVLALFRKVFGCLLLFGFSLSYFIFDSDNVSFAKQL